MLNEKIEMHPFYRRIVDYLFWYPFSSLIRGKLGINIFIRTSKHTNRIRKYATTFKALELMYTYRGVSFNEGLWEAFGAAFWEMFVINAKALRNRLRIMEREIASAIKAFNGEGTVNILSLASGSARGIIEVIHNLKNVNVNVTLVDRSNMALSYSKNLATLFGVNNRFSWIKYNVFNFRNIISDNSQDIVEIVGFLDYQDDSTAVNLLKNIYLILKKGGFLLASNVRDNPEKRFVTEIVNWPMVYRNEEELRSLIMRAGFDEPNIKMTCEPFGVHGMVVARK